MISDNARRTEEFRNAARLELKMFPLGAISFLSCGPFRQMQPAFPAAILFPPPAPAALGFAGAERARTWRATDRNEALGVQSIDGNIVAARLRQNGVARPIKKRVELEQAAAGVEADQPGVAPVRILVGAQAGDPRRRPGERTIERPRLAHIAACQPRLFRLVNAVYALLGDQPFQRRAIGIDRADAAAITAFRLRPQLISFREQPPGIERHHVDIEVVLADPMEDELAFDAEAVREHDGALDRAPQKSDALGRRQGRYIFATNSRNDIKHAALNVRINI